MASLARIEDFVQLNSASAIYKAPHSNGHAEPPARTTTTDTPSLIVLCSWMGAAPKHVAKYTTSYRRLYPQADILWIDATYVSVWIGADLRPAAEFVSSHLKDNKAGDKGPVLLHMFSNGGVQSTTTLATLLQPLHGNRVFDAVVLDSTPGRAEVNAMVTAMAYGLPKQWLLRMTGMVCLYAFVAVYAMWHGGFGVENPVEKIRRLLNDKALFDPETARLYLFSEVDELVRAKDVREHAESARKAGFVDVREEGFDTAAHCALVNEDAGRYWGAVAGVLKKSRVSGNDRWRIGWSVTAVTVA